INQLLIQKASTDINMKSMLHFLLEYTKKADIKSILVDVETEQILNEGRKLGFNYAQGYFTGEPSDKL
ncbi:MAG: EAL domain-containing protein, partial [Campylobacterota bacterium]|nr:EAL domain-containing protein [Campylobacterota bacterium]